MALNKKFSALTLTFASTLLLAACGGNDTDTTEASSEAVSSEVASSEAATGLQDGTYTLVEKNFDDNGWKVNFTIEVANGEITTSDFDYVNEAGEKKSENDDYQAMMAEKTGVGPQDFIPELNGQLVETQDPSSVEVVSGATSSSEGFVKYAEELVAAAEAGNTDTIEIDN
ncbi:MAG TPA: FMN-binding protein [Candidatus Jeotgalibaca merdavium]|uniref:FMN-binding protein n=1 Tax=Candidatus Jeotgalibaca merdavium TaxID=2838627 RepID=A0A9D2I087_9LACT|nr:FMN-binding protein [Candidatus Jeotgalibaca merdavium]